MRYQTFDLTISATGTPHKYLLSAQSSSQGEAAGRTTINVGAAPLAELLAPLESDNTTTANLQALGAVLYQSFFAGEIGMLLNRALGETIGNEALGLRLRLRINPPELAALPWEFLYSPERRLFLAASVETPLSRYINLPEPVRRLAIPEKINLLVVITQNSSLDTTAERHALEKVATQQRDRLTVDFFEGEATSAAIRAALRQKDYHILHYAGHGAFKNEQAFIYLDHAEKLTEPITAEQFAHFFTDYAFTRLVFLNACQGATRSSHQALAGVAPQLVLCGVPAVVAMQEKIANDDAILFATEFYAELCRERDGGQVEVAISRARKALLQEKPNGAAFGNPVLYLRAEEGRLWDVAMPPLPSGGGKKPLLERWQTWVTLIGGILAIVVGMLQLPPMINALLHPQKNEPSKTETATSYLRVFVIDSTSRLPLPEVTLRVEELPVDTVLTGKTTSNGDFRFDKIPAPLNTRARVYAEKDGYRGKNEYISLPGPLRLELEKIK